MDKVIAQSLSQKRSLKVNALSNWTTLIINIIVGFFLGRFVIRHLDGTDYGIWTLVGYFTGYYGLLNLGVGSAITRYVARYAGQGDEESLNETVSTAMTMFCCTAGLALLLSYFVAEPLARFFNVKPEHFNDFRRVVRIIGLATAITFPGNVLATIIRAHERFIAANCVSVFTTLLQAVLSVSFLWHGWGLSGVAWTAVIGEATALTANLVLCRFLTPHVRIRFGRARLRMLRTLIAYGGITTVIVVADMLRSSLNSIVIGKCISMAAVGVYGLVGARIMVYMVQLVAAPLGVLTPRFAALDGCGDHAEMRRLLVKSLAVSSTLAFGVSTMAIVFGKPFILWYAGPEFRDSVPILWLLATGAAFALAQNPAIGFMYALNKHYLYAIATIIEGIANFSLSIVLVLRYGTIGAAFGSLIPMLIVKILVMPVYVSRVAGISVLDYVRPMVPPCLVAATITLTAVFTGLVTREATTLGYLLRGGAVVGAVYAGAFLFIVPDRYHILPHVVAARLPKFRSGEARD